MKSSPISDPIRQDNKIGHYKLKNSKPMKQPALNPASLQSTTFQFISTSSHFLNCKICGNLMKKPIRAHRCGHTFCASCIEPKSIKNCPLCMQKIVNKQKDLLASKLVGELAVRCLNNGCPWKGTYEQFLNFHEKSCGLKGGGIEGWLKQLQTAIGNNNIAEPQKNEKQQEQQKQGQPKLMTTYDDSQVDDQKSRKLVHKIQQDRKSVERGQKKEEGWNEQIDQFLGKKLKNILQ